MPPRFSRVVGGVVAGRLSFRCHVYVLDRLAPEDQRLGFSGTRYKCYGDSLGENFLPHPLLQPPTPVRASSSTSIAAKALHLFPPDS